MPKLHFPLLLCLALAAGGCGASAPPPSETPETPEASMMVIRVVLDVRPESRDAFVAHLTDEAEQVRTLDGCERFQLFQAPDGAARFMLYEEWASAEAFEAYRGSALFAQSLQVLGPMLAGPPDSQYFAAAPQPM